MRLLLLNLWACAIFPLAANGQALWSVLSFVSNTLQTQLKLSRQRNGVKLIVPEPPPDLMGLCHFAGLRSCSKHIVYTDDGFILELHRVPAPVTDAVPVLVMHGNFATSDAFLMRGDDSNLAYVLHEAGYDVWLGNWRGSTHSSRHVRYNSSDPKLYEFSIHELGMYDLPAFVDYILEKTGQPSLHYMGHSMASPALLAGLSSRPEYNDKVRFAALMAPVVWPRGILEVVLKAAFDTFYPELREFVKQTNMWNLTPRTSFVHYLADSFCRDSSPMYNTCRKVYEIIFGATHPTQRMKDFFPHVGATHPAGCSFTAMNHYASFVLSDRFQPPGTSEGRDLHPPSEYNLTAITTPVGLYYGATDVVMSVKDMEPLGRALGSLEESYLVPIDMFSHMDFILATDVRRLLYDHIIKTMKNVDRRSQP